MKLPESWVETTLGRVVVDLQPGFAQRPGAEDEGTTPQIRTHNVSPEGKIDLEGIKHVTASPAELQRYALARGDVVFNNTNSEEWVGKTAVFDKPGQYVFSNHMTRLRVDVGLIDPGYLAMYLHSIWRLGFSKTRAKRWVSQAGIESAALAAFKVPVPPLREQSRMVELLHKTDTLRPLRIRAQGLVEKLAKQRFAEMFGHPAQNPHGFEAVPFYTFGSLERGQSKHRPRDAPQLFGGPYPFIQTGNVSNAGDWITRYESTYSEAGLAQSRLWPKGTLCITIAANIARAAILDFDACFPDSVVGFTPGLGVRSEYVLYCLRFYQEYFEHRAPKSAQMNINLDTLRTLRIPRPPRALQDEFAAFVTRLRSLVALNADQLDSQTKLARYLQIRAFTGELTADWRASHTAEIDEATRERDAILYGRGVRIAASVARL